MIIYTFTLIDSSKLLSLLIPMELCNGTFHINHHDIKNGEKSILVIFYCAKVMLLFELGKKKNKMFNEKKRARCQQRTLFLHFYRGYEKCFFNYEKLLLLSVVLFQF